MMTRLIPILLVSALASVSSPGQTSMSTGGSAANTSFNGSNLPVEPIGSNDLLGVTVYDSPELTRTVRVSPEGDIRLPMLPEPIHAQGLLPAQLEEAIASTLAKDDILVDPIVTVAVLEYRSRPITVVGAVRRPTTFQATGTVTLLDAISQAEGLADNAGSEILVSHPNPSHDAQDPLLIQRIPIRSLLDASDPALNIRLQGGEEVRVTDAGRIFVVGDVKRSGAIYITGGNSQSTVLKALALSEGLDRWHKDVAFIYRNEGGPGGSNTISVPLKEILNGKAPDIALVANDILYIPDAAGKRATLKVLETTLIMGASLGGALIYTYHP
jgi:polysaccharide export outer membrane protein